MHSHSTDPESLMFRSAHVSLRVPDAESAPMLADYLVRNRARFEPFAPRRSPDHYDLEACRARARMQRATSRSGDALHLWLFATGQPKVLIGDIHLTAIVRGAFQAAYLGYALDGAHEGRGLMFEALQLTIHHAFHKMGLHRIMANYLPTNERSGRLLRRLGFVVEGYARDYLQIDGRWRDHVLTAKTSDLPPDTD
jgi:ribosomal-protein-alanine N-acetyltransferase